MTFRPAIGTLAASAVGMAGGRRPLRVPGRRARSAGQLIDVPPGSALETAIGAGNLTDLTGQAHVSNQQGGGGGGVSN